MERTSYKESDNRDNVSADGLDYLSLKGHVTRGNISCNLQRNDDD